LACEQADQQNGEGSLQHCRVFDKRIRTNRFTNGRFLCPVIMSDP
jgi:hypothetical protein